MGPIFSKIIHENQSIFLAEAINIFWCSHNGSANLKKKKKKAVLEPKVSPAFAITYLCNHCNIRFDPIPVKVRKRSLTPRWPSTPHLLRSHVWRYPRIIVSKSHENTSKYVDTVTIFAKTWTKGHWPLDDLWPYICWGHMYVDTVSNFANYHIHTTYYIRTTIYIYGIHIFLFIDWLKWVMWSKIN